MLTVALPIADRRRSYAFYGDGLGFRAVGEPAEDGVPEPLQFALGDGVRVMFVPTGGFGWITGGHAVAPPGTSECVLSLDAAGEAEVDALLRRAEDAGGAIVSAAAGLGCPPYR